MEAVGDVGALLAADMTRVLSPATVVQIVGPPLLGTYKLEELTSGRAASLQRRARGAGFRASTPAERVQLTEPA